MLESLLNPLKAERRPWEMFFIGLVYGSIALLLSYFIFGEDASLITIFLCVMAVSQMLYGAISLEESKGILYSGQSIFQKHGPVLQFYVFLFLGFLASFTLWGTFLPEDIANHLFAVQQRDIQRIEVESRSISGNAIALAPILSHIFLNNLTVLAFCILFSFLFGIGAIFILTWNASIIATAISLMVRTQFAGNYAAGFYTAMLRYLVHGIPEITAFFVGGLAGGIISVAIIKHDFGSSRFIYVVKDSLNLLIFAVALLLVAAVLEVFVTPALV